MDKYNWQPEKANSSKFSNFSKSWDVLGGIGGKNAICKRRKDLSRGSFSASSWGYIPKKGGTAGGEAVFLSQFFG